MAATPLSSQAERVDAFQADAEFSPELGTYAYDVFWKSMQVGKVWVSIAHEDGSYRIAVNGRTSSVIKLVYKLRYRGEARMSSDPFKPVSARIVEKSGRKEKNVTIDFLDSGQVKSVETRMKGGKVVEIQEQEFTPELFSLDPFSAVYLIRHLDWEAGMAEVFDIVTGKRQYRLRFFCHSTHDLDFNGETREAWLIVPQVIALDSEEKAVEESFKIYLSRDGKKEILKIEGEPKIGRVKARIREFQPEAKN